MAPEFSNSTTFQPCLMFGPESILKVVEFYIEIFPNSQIKNISKFGKTGEEMAPNKPQKDDIMSIDFELDGKKFLALSGGKNFPFKPNPSISFIIECDDQEQVDYYWKKLGEEGDESRKMCGWLEDKFGISWQIVPKMFRDLMVAKDNPERTNRVMKAMMLMKKLDISELQKAADNIKE